MKSLKHLSLSKLAEKKNKTYDAEDVDVLLSIISSVAFDEDRPQFNEIKHKTEFRVVDNKLQQVDIVYSQFEYDMSETEYVNGKLTKLSQYELTLDGRFAKTSEKWYKNFGFHREEGPAVQYWNLKRSKN